MKWKEGRREGTTAHKFSVAPTPERNDLFVHELKIKRNAIMLLESYFPMRSVPLIQHERHVRAAARKKID